MVHAISCNDQSPGHPLLTGRKDSEVVKAAYLRNEITKIKVELHGETKSRYIHNPWHKNLIRRDGNIKYVRFGLTEYQYSL
jgi:hypothetical protein